MELMLRASGLGFFFFFEPPVFVWFCSRKPAVSPHVCFFFFFKEQFLELFFCFVLFS